ncbi:hypothetical protein ABI59_11025 [Acidobacteria bacterium Mor1]|nr:hypothetical protein ABI59_11025 [Acidobacteria bacterium Mor1]
MLERLLARWQLKLISLVLALFFWVIMNTENTVLRDVSVPLDIKIDENSILTGTPPRRVTVGLRGFESMLRSLDPVSLAFDVDLRDAPAGQRGIQLAASNLDGLPEGLEVSWIDPDRLRLNIERRMRRVLQVEPTFMGDPPQGYHLYGREILPDRVEVEGPESEVRSMTSIRTEPIPLEPHTKPFQTRVSALPESADVRVLDSRLMDVRIDVDVEPTEKSFRIPVVPLHAEGLLAEAEPSVLDVVISAPPALLGKLEPGAFRAVADATELGVAEDAQTVPVRLDYGDFPPRELGRIRALSIAPETVGVRLQPAPAGTGEESPVDSPAGGNPGA